MTDSETLQDLLDMWRRRLNEIHNKETELRREAQGALEVITAIRRLAYNEGLEVK